MQKDYFLELMSTILEFFYPKEWHNFRDENLIRASSSEVVEASLNTSKVFFLHFNFSPQKFCLKKSQVGGLMLKPGRARH
jgi:hypothetical protein